MNVYYSTREAAGKLKNPVITTGSFDGVHVGHKLIIDRLNEIAREIDGESVLITFFPHPRKVLYPDQTDLKLINTQEEKIALLAKTGLNNLIIIPFSLEFAKTSSHDFITEYLTGHLGARVIVVGHNHHFGHNRQGDFSYLHELSAPLGFTVEEIPLLLIENETVSSTKIRKALFEGNIMRANAYLDHQYIIMGQCCKGSDFLPLGDSVKMCVVDQEKLIPPFGIYATNLLLHGQYLKTMTMISAHSNGTPWVQNFMIYDKAPEEGELATLYFYKKIKELPANTSAENIQPELLQAKEEVEDLLY